MNEGFTPNTDLDVLQVLIDNPGESLTQFSRSFSKTPQRTSDLCSKWERLGVVLKQRKGMTVHIYPDQGSSIIRMLYMVRDLSQGTASIKLGDLLVVHLVNQRPLTLMEIMVETGESRSTIYRRMQRIHQIDPALLIRPSKRMGTIRADDSSACHYPLVKLAETFYHGVEPSASSKEIGPRAMTTIRTRSLLHLLAFLELKEQYTLPNGMTQKGIARALWTDQRTISVDLKRSMNLGLVESRKAYIENESRRFKTYHLTKKGTEIAIDLKDRISRTLIDVIDNKSVQRQMRADKVPALVDDRFSMVEVLDHLKDHDVLNIAVFQRRAEERRGTEFISNLTRIPDLRYFYGREDELAAFNEWLKDAQRPVMMMSGIAGTGKTTFLRQAMKEVKKEWNVFYISTNRWSTFTNTIKAIAHFLQRMKRPQLTYHIRNKPELVMDELVHIINVSLEGTRALLVFDDVHNLKDNLKALVDSLVNIRPSSSLKVVVCGRHLKMVPKVAQRRMVKVDLKGLSKEAGELMAIRRGIPEEKWSVLYKMTKGHPLSLELIDPTSDQDGYTVQGYLEKEVVRNLTEDERGVLGFLSVFRYPVTADALDYHPIYFSKAEDLLDELVERSLISRTGNLYGLHDVLRGHFNSRLKRSERKYFHYLASTYHSRLDSEHTIMERIYHLDRSQRYRTLAELLRVHGEKLLVRGFSEDLGRVLSSTQEKKLPDSARVLFNHLLGEIAYYNGDWDTSLTLHTKTALLCKDEQDPEIMARSLSRMATVHMNRSEYHEAVAEFLGTIDIAHRHGLVLLEARALKDLASHQYISGYTEDCLLYLHELELLAQKESSKEVQALVMEQGWVYGRVYGEYNRSEQAMRRAMRLYEDLDQEFKYLRVSNNLGLIYMDQEKWEDALALYEDMIARSGSIGTLRLTAFGLLNSAICLVKLQRYDDVLTRLEDALSRFIEIEDKRMISNTRGEMAIYYKKRGNMEMASELFETSIAGYEQIGIVDSVPEYLYEYGEVKLMLNDFDGARALFEQTLEHSVTSNLEIYQQKASAMLEKLKSFSN